MNSFAKEKRQKEILKSQLIDLLPRMRRFAQSLVHNPDQADDLVQDACEKALNLLHQYRIGSRLDSWIFRIIYTRWIDTLRRSKNQRTHLALVKATKAQDTPENDSDTRVSAVLDIKSALKRLPDEQRVCLILVAIEGYSYTEAGAILDAPQGTVASRVARARSALNDMFSRDCQHPALKLISGKK